MKRMVLVSLFVCAGLYATGPEMGMVSYVEGEVVLLRKDRELLPVSSGLEVRSVRPQEDETGRVGGGCF